jgi:hypothetical protein
MCGVNFPMQFACRRGLPFTLIVSLSLTGALSACERPTQDLLTKVKDGIEFNGHIGGDSHVIFEHACKLGHEGIVVKRKDLRTRAAEANAVSKTKNPDSSAMKRVENGTF